MAKEEKPLEYQRRIRDTKGAAQRLDLNYLRRPSFLRVVRARVTWVVVALALLASIPLVTGFGGSRRAVMNGSVASAHAIFENKCESCHTAAFAGVPDSACQTCHDGPPHPAKSIDTGRAAHTPPCAQCHLEHQGRGQLATVASGNCTSCHADLASHTSNAKVKNASAFRAGKHPEFSTAAITDSRPLRLNHAIHMPAAAKTIRGMKLPMKCADCHVTDRNSPTGALLPVTFEQNCKSCHARELEFDVHQVLGPDAAPAPHTRDPKTIHEFVVAAYRGRPDADRLVMDSEEYLFGRKCAYCHEGGGPNVQKVGAIRGRHADSAPWFARAEFDHRAHRAVGCDTCHGAARRSTKTADVLIPKMESCLPCHADAQAGLDRCGVCHQYHNRSLEIDVERKFGGTR
jgi:hypothetical protein